MGQVAIVPQWVIESEAGHLYGVAVTRAEAVELARRLMARRNVPELTVYRVSRV